MNGSSEITGLILAGGRGERMQGDDKGLVMFRGEPLIAHAIAHLGAQVASLVLSCNRNLDRYREFGFPVVEDSTHRFGGPLAGIASAAPHIHTELCLIVPCDCPTLPDDLAHRLVEARRSEPAVVAHDGERIQPLIVLVNRSGMARAAECLERGTASVKGWLHEIGFHEADFTDLRELLVNINTREALE